MRTLPAFLDFQMLFLGGNARHFLRAFSLVFVCASQECPHAGTFTIILWTSVDICALFVACFSFFGAHGTLPGHFSHKLAHFSSAWGRKATM